MKDVTTQAIKPFNLQDYHSDNLIETLTDFFSANEIENVIEPLNYAFFRAQTETHEGEVIMQDRERYDSIHVHNNLNSFLVKLSVNWNKYKTHVLDKGVHHA